MSGRGGARRLAARGAALVVLAILLSGARSERASPVGTPLPGPAGPVRKLLLVGDTGAPAPVEPVLGALRSEAARDPAGTLVVVLGDDVYPDGVPAEGRPGRLEAESRLFAQVDAVVASGARGLFLPGNHDWMKGDREGWDAVRREEALVVARGRGRVGYLPGGGCPGPVVLDVSPDLRLAVLDTQWWLQAGPRPEGEASPCREKSEADVVASLRAAAEGAGSRAFVVLAHHPLLSGGEHGGRFGWRQHLFPLVDAARWAWLPLPGIGSLYPAVRSAGKGSPQDLSSPPYRRLIESMERALGPRPALLWASGHEHNMQFLEGGSPAARYLLVSGCGIYGNGTRVERLPTTRFAARDAGFFAVRFPTGAPPEAEAFVATPAGAGEERFRAVLR